MTLGFWHSFLSITGIYRLFGCVSHICNFTELTVQWLKLCGSCGPYAIPVFFLLFWGWSGSASVFQYHADHCTSKDSNKIWVNKHVKLYQLPIHWEFACEIQVKFVWRSMWNWIATHWEFACEICVKKHMKLYSYSLRICMWNCGEICVKNQVKFYCKSVWIYMWNSMWNAGENVCERVDITSHPFHTCFTM